MPRRSKPNLHHSGVWRFTFRGQVYYSPTEAAAWRKLADLQEPPKKQPPPDTVDGLIAAFILSRPSDKARERLRLFAEFASELALAAVDSDLLADYLTWLRKRGYRRKVGARGRIVADDADGERRPKRDYQPWTLAELVGYARRCLMFGQRRGWLETMPDSPRLPAVGRRDGFTASELSAIFAALDSSPGRAGVAHLLRFCLATGCRPGEACALLWSDVDTAAGLCRLQAHKTRAATGKPRTIYLTPDATELLGKVAAERRERTGHTPGPGEPVFRGRVGRSQTSAGVRSTFRRAALEALGASAEPYRLRHSFAMFAAGRGYPAEVISKLLGHSRPETARWYVEVTDQRARDAAAALTGTLRGGLAG